TASVQWGFEAAATAVWTGVPLSSVLRAYAEELPKSGWLTAIGGDPGEEGVFTVHFPGDGGEGEDAGREEELRILLRERKVRELPPLDDDFARSVGDFADLAALRARVEADLRREAEGEAEATLRHRLLDAIGEANPIAVPASMVDRYLDSMLRKPEDDEERARQAELRGHLRASAERAVRHILILERLAEEHGLKATEDEVDARVEEIARANDADPSQIYARLQKAGRLTEIEREITEGKIFDFLKGQSTIRDES
ncbi:MAG: hypothetical protein RQ751_05780, partial [Longimicrobiales bacterium]|nr:hypothetical protein [Longimicrobiales bacterium]